MIQRPSAIGLILCRRILLEEGTRDVTWVSRFRRLRFRAFPTPFYPINVSAILRDGMGKVPLRLIVSRLTDMEAIAERDYTITFRDPRNEMLWTTWLTDLSFPEAGSYQFTLEAEKEPIASCDLRVEEVRR
jgi:hypothetical protein